MIEKNRKSFKELREEKRKKNNKGSLLFGIMGTIIFLCIICFGGYEVYSYFSSTSKATASTETKQATKTEVPDAVQNTKNSDDQKSDVTSNKVMVTNAPGYSILIKKSEYKLYLLNDGKVVDSWGVALGKNPGQKKVSGDMKTPEGTFSVDEIDNASTWTHDFGDGKGVIAHAYGPWFISLNTDKLSGGKWGGIGIHGTHDPASIGTRASEGCIRLNNENLVKLVKHVKVGTKVTIEE